MEKFLLRCVSKVYRKEVYSQFYKKKISSKLNK